MNAADIKKIRKRLEDFAEQKGALVIKKEDSGLMKFLSKILFFNKRFMSNYVTTLGGSIYFPEEVLENDWSFITVLAHELVHVEDFKKFTFPGMSFLYLLPQILGAFSLLSVLAFWNFSWLWCLLFLLFLLPIPSFSRKWLEMRGYTMSLAILYWLYEDQEQDLEVPSYYIDQFTHSYYYWMWPFPKAVKKELEDNLEKIKDGTIEEQYPLFREIKELVKSE